MNSGGVEDAKGPSPALPASPKLTEREPSQLTWKRVFALAITQLSALPIVNLITKPQTPSLVVAVGTAFVLIVAVIGILLVS